MTIKEMNKWTKDKVANFIGANVAEVKQKDKNLFSRIILRRTRTAVRKWY